MTDEEAIEQGAFWVNLDQKIDYQVPITTGYKQVSPTELYVTFISSEGDKTTYQVPREVYNYDRTQNNEWYRENEKDK